MSHHNPLPLRPARVRHWLRWLLACALFSALHNPVGAWVVSALGDGPVVQVCTPLGMQWVQLDAVASGAQQDDSDGPVAPPLACVWAMAHQALEPTVVLATGAGLARQGGGFCLGRSLSPPSDRAWRVLLMSAMRAPPVRLA